MPLTPFLVKLLLESITAGNDEAGGTMAVVMLLLMLVSSSEGSREGTGKGGANPTVLSRLVETETMVPLSVVLALVVLM
jgi:hypothetical protein